MSSPLAIARSLVLDRENTNTGAKTVFSVANAGLAIVHSHHAGTHRPIAWPSHATRFNPQGRRPDFQIAAVGGLRLPPANDPAETIAIADPSPPGKIGFDHQPEQRIPSKRISHVVAASQSMRSSVSASTIRPPQAAVVLWKIRGSNALSNLDIQIYGMLYPIP